MSNVKALNSKGLSPEVVLQSVVEALPEMRDVYVVGISKEGEPTVWATGDLTRLSYASLVLQDLALKYLNGEVIP